MFLDVSLMYFVRILTLPQQCAWRCGDTRIYLCTHNTPQVNLWDTSLMHHRYLMKIHTNTCKYMYPPDTVGGCINPIFGGKRDDCAASCTPVAFCASLRSGVDGLTTSGLTFPRRIASHVAGGDEVGTVMLMMLRPLTVLFLRGSPRGSKLAAKLCATKMSVSVDAAAFAALTLRLVAIVSVDIVCIGPRAVTVTFAGWRLQSSLSSMGDALFF